MSTLIGVWQGSLLDVTTFINETGLADNVLQLVEDRQMKHGYWVMLRVTAGQAHAIREIKSHPKLSVIP